MKTDQVVFISTARYSETGSSGKKFLWDPYADQVFTPSDSEYDRLLTGAAASFNKNDGRSISATGAVLIVTDDEGTTAWGRITDSGLAKGLTVVGTSAPEGEILFSSRGTLVIGDPVRSAELSIKHANGDAANSGPGDERVGVGLSVRNVEFSNVVIEIDNESGLQMAGSQFGSFASLTIDWALISVHNRSVCHITPNAGERRIVVNSALQVLIGHDSWVYMGGSVWELSRGGAVRFSLDGSHRVIPAVERHNFCHLWGFDFLSGLYYPSGMFNFITKDENGLPLRNHGEFVIENVGNTAQWTAILEKGLIAVDGTFVTDTRLVKEDFRDGNLHIRLKEKAS